MSINYSWIDFGELHMKRLLMLSTALALAACASDPAPQYQPMAEAPAEEEPADLVDMRETPFVETRAKPESRV
jgi:hypothetical protein